MKKQVAILLLVMWMPITGLAIGFDWGLKGGINLTQLKLTQMTDNFEAGNRAGFFCGPCIELRLVAGFGFNAAAEYNMAKYTLNGVIIGGQEYDSKRTDHSLELPVNVRYSFKTGRRTKLFLETGPQFGFYFADSDWRKAVGIDKRQIFRNDNMATTWNVGAGVRFKHLEVGVSYNCTLGEKFKDLVADVGGDHFSLIGQGSQYKRNTFRAHVGILF